MTSIDWLTGNPVNCRTRVASSHSNYYLSPLSFINRNSSDSRTKSCGFGQKFSRARIELHSRWIQFLETMEIWRFRHKSAQRIIQQLHIPTIFIRHCSARCSRANEQKMSWNNAIVCRFCENCNMEFSVHVCGNLDCFSSCSVSRTWVRRHVKLMK